MKKIIPISLVVFLFTASLSVRAETILAPANDRIDRVATEFLWQKIKDLKVGERPRIVVVLGGGGARGLAHIGVLRVFEQEGVPIDQIIGISVGSLLGALYAGGVSVDQLDQMANEIGWNKLTNYSRFTVMKLISSDELLSTKRMETYLNQHLGNKSFADLNIPFTCIATDLQTGQRIVFNDGSVAFAARASATIPGIFKPVPYGNHLLVDGGLIDILPTDLAPTGDWNLVVGVLPKVGYETYNVSNVLSTLVRSIEIQKTMNINQDRKTADFLIEPNVGAMSLVDLHDSKDAIEAGIKATQERVLELKKTIIRMMVEKKEKKIGVP